MRFFVSALAVLFAACAVASGAIESTRRASLTGGRGDRGKCTIEVVVDDVAEVAIEGDMGRLVTLSGQPSEWRRFLCSDPIPRNPVNFRFIGVDGRGHQELVRDPRNNRGVAVIRIEDRQGGREGYTFDLEWEGSAGGYGPGPIGPGRDEHRRDEAFMVSCSSDDGRRHYCDVETRGGVRLVRQRSEAECRQGYSWDYDRRGIWVDRGCRADFEVRRH